MRGRRATIVLCGVNGVISIGLTALASSQGANSLAVVFIVQLMLSLAAAAFAGGRNSGS
jgi:hypothetical protein